MPPTLNKPYYCWTKALAIGLSPASPNCAIDTPWLLFKRYHTPER